MPQLHRRQWIHQVLRTAGALGACATAGLTLAPGGGRSSVAAEDKPQGCTLSIGTYAMKGVKLERALQTIAAIGFDGVEIAVMPGYDGAPDTMPAARREQVRKQLDSDGLRLTALMEHIAPADDTAAAKDDLARLEKSMELARQLGGTQPPLIQTVLGGGTWEARKTLFRDRLGDWLFLAKKQGIVLAIKPHRGGAMSRPSEAIWLIEQLGNSPHLRMVYDYSHYAFRDMPLEETVRTALPFTAHVAAKDAVQRGEKVAFLLPGEENRHFPQLIGLLYAGGYRGDVCCEVSSMVSNRSGYDPVAAAQTCYKNMSAAFREAEVPRRS